MRLISLNHFVSPAWLVAPLVLAVLLPRPLRSEVQHGIKYGDAGATPLLMDAEIPEGKGPFPAVILVHGGGWITGDRATMLQPLFAPLHAAGYAWFSIDYRLATDVTNFGAAIGDVQTAVAYVRAHAAQFKVDPERIALIGESAGGHLAAMAALTAGPASAVQSVVAFYAPMDLPELARSSPAIPANIKQALQSDWGALMLAGMQQLSPVTHVSAGMPPFLLIHGTGDPLVPLQQSVAMCKDMHAAGASCELVEVPGAGHGLRWWGRRDTGIYQEAMLKWLNQHLAHKPV